MERELVIFVDNEDRLIELSKSNDKSDFVKREASSNIKNR